MFIRNFNDLVEIARDARDLLEALKASAEHRGGGTHRCPAGLLLDLQITVDDMYNAACQARDDAEHFVRGL